MWGIRGVRISAEQGIFPLCIKEENWSHMLRCEGTWIWVQDLGIPTQYY
jgi:hypothetical protein